MAHPSRDLLGFTRLSEGVWVSDPSSSERAAIQLVILCTWMGAALKHVAKYTLQYQSLLPDARILVIQSNVQDVMWRTHRTQRVRMQPARQIIKAAASSHHPIRMHIFSNGGVLSATQLVSQYRAETDQTIPLQSLIVDSAPGKPRFDAAINALSQLAPRSGFRRLLCIALAYFGFGLIWIYIKALRREFMVARIRRELNSVRFFDRHVPRVYIYSRADKLIDWTEVKEHADVARAVGYPTQEELFETSSHVAHAMQDKVRYWKIVERTFQPQVG